MSDREFKPLPQYDTCSGAHRSINKHNCDDLTTLFNQCFSERFNTQLVRGDSEPIYLPADQCCAHHRVVFAHGFFSSALHEIAHWCIAGGERRQQVDYGYWYAADGRSAAQQAEFERVEVKPQALEWILSNACGKRFRVSVDNLTGEPTDSGLFKHAVHQQVLQYCEHAVPARAATFRYMLCGFYQTDPVLSASAFLLSDC